MQTTRWGMLGLLAVLGCSGQGGGGATPGGASTLTVVAASPADGATEVPYDATIRVTLDADVHPDSLDAPRTGLFDGQRQRVAGTIAPTATARTIEFRPSGALAPATDYTFQLSPLTADRAGRIADRPLQIRFRTVDQRGPVVLGASIQTGATAVARRQWLVITFDEPLAGVPSTATAFFEDQSGGRIAADARVTGHTLRLRPEYELPGGTPHRAVLRAGSVQDRHGNWLGQEFSVSFTTAPDRAPPHFTRSSPDTNELISPTADLRLEFNESIDPTSVTPNAVQWTDASGAAVPFTAATSRDRRHVHLQAITPLPVGTTQTLTLVGGSPNSLRDLSGNLLRQRRQLRFTVGSDVRAPAIAATWPAPGQRAVSPAASIRIELDEPLDPDRIATAASLWAEGRRLDTAIGLERGGRELRLRPRTPLPPSTTVQVQIAGGHDAVTDRAGNPLAAPSPIDFETDASPRQLSVLLAPAGTAVPPNSTLAAIFDAPVEPSTVTATSVLALDANGVAVPSSLSLDRDGRVVRLHPSGGWSPGQPYTFVVVGGPRGVADRAGTPLEDDALRAFTAATLPDLRAPLVELSTNGTATARTQDMVVPPHGFTIDVAAFDPENAFDPGSVVVTIRGAHTAPGAETIFAEADVDPAGLRFAMPPHLALAPGDYQITATAADLAGNPGIGAVVRIRVEEPTPGSLPFDLPQVVHVVFDLDRNRNGVPDLLDDLLLLGLATAGDPSGTNATMVALMQDAIIAQVHALLGRTANGDPIGPDAIPMRLVSTPPRGVPFAQIACGGFDPEGVVGRGFGDPSSGTLGRAYYDHRNSNRTDRNIGSKPGLGVFPAELALFEARIHQQSWPSYLTTFGRRFIGLAPAMGGVPAGSHPLDPIVLATRFDPATASPAELARYVTVMQAIDDWAVAIGTILAHEIGHAVGLTAEGENPRGLHGDASLHNANPGPADVMSASVGYESLVALKFAFRDVTTAYLRQRLMVR